MMYSYLHVFLPVLGLVLNVLVQVAAFRFLGRVGLLKSIVAGFVAGLIGTLAADVFVLAAAGSGAGQAAAGLLTNAILCAALGYCYFHFVNLGQTARRVRILRELCDAEDGLTMGELLARYAARDMVRLRLERLVNSGQVVLRDGKYFVGRRTVLLMAKSIAALKRLVLGRRTGLE